MEISTLKQVTKIIAGNSGVIDAQIENIRLAIKRENLSDDLTLALTRYIQNIADANDKMYESIDVIVDSVLRK